MKKVFFLSWLILGIVLATFIPLMRDIMANAKSETGEVESYQNLQLSKEAKKLLEKNSFVVVPTKAYKDMTNAYTAFHKDNLPIFLTTDSILHTTHSLFDYLLRTIEVNHLMGDLNQLTKFMLNASTKDYETAEDEKVKKAIYTNIAFFSVAARLLNEKESPPFR